MYVGIMKLELNLHGVSSLKAKRSVVRSLLGRLRNRFPVSGAEVSLQDSWQRTCLGFSMVACDRSDIDSVFRRIEDAIEMSGLAEPGLREVDIFPFQTGHLN
ncbi:MAG: DUF503 domain-containing protein [Deltaproteobacteria bacterium]|nr:MAG: DUF503 domain-containing protein [Deltaproteobacteria bacterium]